MTKYAASDDFAIYAIADSSEQAIDKAQDECGGPQYCFKVARISDEFARQIDDNGWNGNRQSFEVKNGEIFETTNE
jgi:L-asparaginase II